DVTISELPLYTGSGPGQLALGITIENAVNPEDFLDFQLESGTGPNAGMGPIATISTDNTNMGFGFGLSTSSNQVSLRMRYSAASSSVTNSCAFGGVGSGAEFTTVSSGPLPWNLSTSTGFRFGLDAYSQGVPLSTGQAFVDNFRFSSPPGAVSATISTAVEIWWPSQLGVNYQ